MNYYEWLRHEIEKLKQLPILPAECIEWPYYRCWTGHGNVVQYFGKKKNGNGARRMHKAHRLAFEWYHGRKPRKNILHLCDNPACYNPAHLYENTQKQNMADKRERGTHREMKGPRLRARQVEEIISLLEGGLTNQEIADRFDVSVVTVSQIRNGRTWKHIPRPWNK